MRYEFYINRLPPPGPPPHPADYVKGWEHVHGGTMTADAMRGRAAGILSDTGARSLRVFRGSQISRLCLEVHR